MYKRQDILSAIKRGDFYASQGPEVHLRREGDRFTVDCSPVSEIIFDTNVSWAKGRAVRGEGLTHAEYTASATPGRLGVFGVCESLAAQMCIRDRMYKNAGLDFTIIDCEHGAFDYSQVAATVTAFRLSGCLLYTSRCV